MTNKIITSSCRNSGHLANIFTHHSPTPGMFPPSPTRVSPYGRTHFVGDFVVTLVMCTGYDAVGVRDIPSLCCTRGAGPDVMPFCTCGCDGPDPNAAERPGPPGPDWTEPIGGPCGVAEVLFAPPPLAAPQALTYLTRHGDASSQRKLSAKFSVCRGSNGLCTAGTLLLAGTERPPLFDECGTRCSGILVAMVTCPGNGERNPSP